MGAPGNGRFNYGSDKQREEREETYYRPKVAVIDAKTRAALEELESIRSWDQLVRAVEEQQRKRGW